MLRRALLVALIALVTVPIAAQTPGWKVRLDGSVAVTAFDANPGLKILPTEKGLHLTGGPAAIIYDPSNTAQPIYRVKATFTQLKKTDTNAYYGIFFGGNNMDSA